MPSYKSLGSVVSARPARVRRVARSLGSLGDDSLDAEMSEVEWRKRMLAEQTAVRQWQEWWVQRDAMQRWMQLAATLAIPLSAAIWRALLGRRRASQVDLG